jgi:O-antigen ligase
VLTCVLFTAQAADPVNVIKLTALLLTAIIVVVTAMYRAVRYRVVRLPLGPAGAVAALLAAAFIASAATAPVTHTAILGAYGRNSGLLAYLAALALFLTGVRVLERPHARVVVGAVVVAGLFTATYGLLQKAGIDPIAWNNPFNPIIAALGNPNFASGYLGIAASVGAGGAAYRAWAAPWRVLSGVTAGLCLLTAALSDSVQGPIAAAAGLIVVAIAVTLDLTSSRRRTYLSGLGALAALGVGILVAGAVAGAGPASGIFSDVGSEARNHYWSAALAMFRDNTLLGVGLDHYGASWWSARSPESIAALTGANFSDAAHSVPLQMLAQGGLVLGLAYGAFFLLALTALARGLLRLQGPERQLLGAVGAGWAAYQVQSAVSIDQVPLLVLHFVLAAAVIATAGRAGLRELRLPGAAKPVVPHRNDARARRRTTTIIRDRPLTAVDYGALTVMGVVAIAAAWQATLPLRANAAVKEGASLQARGDGTAAFRAYQRATELLPGQPQYWSRIGGLFQNATPPQISQARAAYAEAVERDPYDVGAVKAAAGLAEQEGDLDAARTLFQRAVELDPLNPETVVAAATFELRHSGAEAARQLLERTVVRIPNAAAAWAALGDARAVLGDAAGARVAYETALALEPGQATATEGLTKLDA